MRVQSRSLLVWGALLALLAPGCKDESALAPKPPPAPPQSPPELILALRDAYRERDYQRFSSLFSTDADALYLFYLNEPPGVFWEQAEELRIHRRMFQPENQHPPLPQERWLVSIEIELTPLGEFTEQPLYYGPPVNQNPGLDPARWKAWEASYGTYVFFRTRGETHYQVSGRAHFVVIEDRTKQPGEVGKCLLCRWFDLGSEGFQKGEVSSSGVQSATWSGVKVLYR